MKSDVTCRDHVSVVMDAGSCIVNFIVNFICDGTVFAYNSEIYNIGAHAQWLRVNQHPRQRSRSDKRPSIAYTWIKAFVNPKNTQDCKPNRHILHMYAFGYDWVEMNFLTVSQQQGTWPARPFIFYLPDPFFILRNQNNKLEPWGNKKIHLQPSKLITKLNLAMISISF